MKFSFFRLIGVGHAHHHLADIHLPLGRFAQVEFGIAQAPARKAKPFATQPQARQEGIELTNIKKRISLKILNIEILDHDAAGTAHIDASDADLRTQTARHDRGRLIDHGVLHTRDSQQERQHKR